MAVSFTTEIPTTPNAVYTRLGTKVESTDVSLPQYQFVMDVYESGSSEYIARLTQTPNDFLNNGSIIFDPSRIFQGELGFDNNWKVTGSIQPVNSLKTFELKIGEQYGTSPSSSVTVYPNQASMSLKVFPGVVNPVEKEPLVNVNAWNFDTSRFTGPGNPYLTNCPNAQVVNTIGTSYDVPYLIESDDYFTVTSYREPYQTTGSISVNFFKFENGTDTFVTAFNITASNSTGEFTTWGLGPKNISNLNPTIGSLIEDGSINYYSTYDDYGEIAVIINDKWDGTYPSRPHGFGTPPIKECSDDYVRFAFINQYGFWDYYNVYNPVKATTALERETYNKTQIEYGPRSLFRTDYNGWRTGKSQYFLRSTDTYSIDTDYIDKQTANWLEELLESPEVFIQEGSDFVPIVITNNTYDHNNSTSRNKLFNYTIEWVYANPRSSRL